jgi:hypothetical protein
MLGRAWVSVPLIAILSGCASRSRPKSFHPDVNIPLVCAASIRLVDCDPSSSPPNYRTAAVTYRTGCEQAVGAK